MLFKSLLYFSMTVLEFCFLNLGAIWFLNIMIAASFLCNFSAEMQDRESSTLSRIWLWMLCMPNNPTLSFYHPSLLPTPVSHTELLSQQLFLITLKKVIISVVSLGKLLTSKLAAGSLTLNFKITTSKEGQAMGEKSGWREMSGLGLVGGNYDYKVKINW